MTQFINISVDKNIDRKPKSKNHTNRILFSAPLQLRKKIIPITQNTFLLTLKSKNFQQKIQFFTTLDLFQSYINIKIIPCDSAGNCIRSKQNFNKNGWIRKHINENKNKFLKVNPLTGEVFFIYSFFISQNFRMSQLWKELFQKLDIIEKQLPQLLSKIINLQGKQKPMSFIQQVIETNKLVCTIKLAEIFRQRMKIESQFQNLNPENHQKNHKDQGYIQKKQIQQFSINSQPLQKVINLNKTVREIQKDFNFYIKVLQSGTFKIGKSNILGLTLLPQDEQKIQSKLRKLSTNGEFRYKIQQFNNQLFITVKKQEHETVRKIKRLLYQIGQEVEYKFLDKFIQQNSFEDVIMTVATKELQLADYMRKNFLTISYETKFRIFIQTLGSVTTLWMRHNIAFQTINMTYFTIVKNMTVKLKKFQKANYIHPSRLESDQVLTIYNDKKAVLKELADIYFEVFFNKKSINIQSQKCVMKLKPQYKKQHLIFQSLNQLTKAYYPNNLFTLIIGLNYFFIQQYFNNIESQDQGIYEEMQMEFIKKEGSRHFGRKLQQKKKLEEAKKGGPRVDMILAMCIQFLEQHESQPSVKGGQM